ncbi:hypothetical protein NQ315_001170 [Exocentrus adspersus]|uniref:Uncharacterized protein n=1 Tax=Exocentrus adspersus TaxID=1586481 RepID=A0AAV8WFT1_9CUCU|nr:hypothetical protein NQ315_001170 [Exocentrus adspersus]
MVACSAGVLCSQSVEKLAWYPTSYYTIQNELATAVVNPVLGGINAFNQIVYIGRYVETTSAQRPVQVGSIVKDDKIHYTYKGLTSASYYFEILVINGKCTGD